MDAPKRFARAGEVGFPGSLGVEPCTLYPLDSAVIAGNCGDQCREAVDTIVVAMDEIWMKSQCREAAVADGTSMQVGFRVGAIDGSATPPEAALRFFTVIATGVISGICRSGSWQWEECYGLIHRMPQRCSAGVQADEIEQIAMFVGRGVCPFTGYAWRRHAHKERAPLGASCVADCPISALFAAAWKVAAADVFRPYAQRGGNFRSVHGVRSLRDLMARNGCMGNLSFLLRDVPFKPTSNSCR